MHTDRELRQQIVKHLKGGMAFLPIDKFINDIPYDKTGIVPEGLPYSLWQLLYHLKFAQWDILEFSRNANYEKVNWPDDYWPEHTHPKSEAEWKATITAFLKEREEMADLILDEANDLYEPFAHGSGQNLLREALLVIEHNAYHIGQILVIMRHIGLY